jgi:hypothetical protein
VALKREKRLIMTGNEQVDWDFFNK